MKKEDLNRGFDSPRKSKAEDRLNRWKFAENIYSLVRNTPGDWSNRIGIYGGWGEGKTSVLEFISTIASEEKQIIVWFNPWQFTTPEELWEAFVITMYETLQEYEVDVKSELIKMKGRKITRTVIDKSQSLSQIIPFAEAGLPIIKNFLNVNKKVLTKLPQKIFGKKIIILIDDLDRANTDLIPQLLFAVKELLDLPGLTFILAFDPEIVNSLLKTKGYTGGKDFLDKIIDFPEWLPEPDENTYKEYLRIELAKFIEFVNVDSVFQIFKYLQKNPRKLKQFVRGLVILKDEIVRYRKEDINWVLLLLILVLKTYYPKISNTILTDDELWDRFDTENWLGRGNNPSSTDRSERELHNLITSLSIDDKNKENNLRNIINHIGSIVKSGLTESIKYHINIIQGRSILTWKEYGNFLEQFDKDQSKDFIDEAIKKYNWDNVEVLKELFRKTVHNREWLLNQASDSNLGSELKKYANGAILALSLIKIISFEEGGLSGANPFLTTEDFTEIYKHISRWLHFTMPKLYTDLRKKEKEFLIKLCNETTIDLKSLLSYLKPWSPFRTGVYDSPSEKKLSEELGFILEKRLSVNLMDKFIEDGYVYSLFGEEKFVEHYILLRKDSYFWSKVLRKKFFGYRKNVDNKEALTLNAIHFISLIDYTFFDPLGNRSVFNESNAIIYDQEIMFNIWVLATLQVINPRMFKSLENFKEKVGEKLKLKLPEPKWWKRIKKMVEERSKNKLL